MITAVGWVGSFLFCFCGVPQAWASYRDGHARGMSHGFLWMWCFGEVCTLWYVAALNASRGATAPLLTNYVLNLAFLLVIIRYKYWPRRRGVKRLDFTFRDRPLSL